MRDFAQPLQRGTLRRRGPRVSLGGVKGRLETRILIEDIGFIAEIRGQDRPVAVEAIRHRSVAVQFVESRSGLQRIARLKDDDLGAGCMVINLRARLARRRGGLRLSRWRARGPRDLWTPRQIGLGLARRVVGEGLREGGVGHLR